MKIISKIENGEKFSYKGDVTIEADVGENAEINVEDGLVRIMGNVHPGARIRVNLSEEMRARMNAVSVTRMTMFGGVVIQSVISNGSSFNEPRPEAKVII